MGGTAHALVAIALLSSGRVARGHPDVVLNTDNSQCTDLGGVVLDGSSCVLPGTYGVVGPLSIEKRNGDVAVYDISSACSYYAGRYVSLRGDGSERCLLRGTYSLVGPLLYEDSYGDLYMYDISSACTSKDGAILRRPGVGAGDVCLLRGTYSLVGPLYYENSYGNQRMYDISSACTSKGGTILRRPGVVAGDVCLLRGTYTVIGPLYLSLIHI